MATREAIIQLRLEDRDAVARLGKLAIEANDVRTSMKELKAEIKQTGEATTDQARQMGELVARQKNLSGQSRELSNDLSGLTAAGMRFRDKMAGATLEAIKQSGVLGQLAARSDTLTKEITELNASFKAGTITEAQYTQQQNVLQKELTETTAKMAQMDAKLDKLNKDFKEGKITAEQFKAGVQSVNAETAKASGAFTKGIGNLKNYALGMFGVVAAVQGLRAVFSNVVGIIANFDKAQSRLAGILGTTKDGMTGLTEQAKRLGATTAFTASQVSDAQTELAKLGFTQNEIIASTPAVLDLARAAGADLSQAAEVTAATLNAFGLEASEAQRVTDVMAKSFSTSALDLDKFTFAMRVVAPVAKNAGISIEETTALIGVLADNGLRAETSGTGLRNILGKLAKTGMTFKDAMTQINTSTDKTKTAMDLFGLEASTVAVVLADNTEKVGDLKEGLDAAAGSTRELAQAMDDNLIGDKLKLTSAWEGFILSLDEGDGVFSRVSRNITTGLTDILSYFTLLNSTPDPFESIGYGKGSAVKAERLTKAYREELEKLIETRAEEQGWKDKSLAVSAGLLGVKDREIQAMREITAAQLNRLKTLEDVEDMEGRVADALSKSDNLLEKSGKTSLKTARLMLLQRAVEARRLELTKQATDATNKSTETLDEDNDAKDTGIDKTRKLTQAEKELIDQLRNRNRTLAALNETEAIGTDDRVLSGFVVDQREERIEEDPFITTLPQRLEAMDDERVAFEELQMAKAQSLQGFANALGGLAEQGSAMANVILGVEKAAAAATVIIAAQKAITEATAAAAAVPAVLPPGIPNPAFAIAQSTAAAQIARIKLTAATSLGTILAQAIKGFEEGGYTSSHRSDKQPVGVVHANEYVVPAPVLRNPKYAAMVEELERARRGYGLGYTPGSFAVGGPTGSTYTFTKGSGGMVTNPGGLQEIENAARMANTPIFVRVDEINQVQGRVARIAERSTL